MLVFEGLLFCASLIYLIFIQGSRSALGTWGTTAEHTGSFFLEVMCKSAEGTEGHSLPACDSSANLKELAKQGPRCLDLLGLAGARRSSLLFPDSRHVALAMLPTSAL